MTTATMQKTTPPKAQTLIDHWSNSSMQLLLRDPLGFKKKYVMHIYDDLSSPAGVAGSAGHKALEVFYNGKTEDEAKQAGLDYIENTSETSVNWGKTGSKKKVIAAYNQGLNFYFSEMKEYHRILAVEYTITSWMTKENGDKLPLPGKAKIDLIVENELGEIEIIDHKFVTQYSAHDEDNPKHWLQAMFNYHLVKAKYGKAPARMIFNECKVTKNDNDSDQIKPYVIEFKGIYGDFAAFYKLFNACTDFINNPKAIFLPNIADVFNGKNSFETFRMGVIGTERPARVRKKTEMLQYTEKNYIPSAMDKAGNEALTPEERIKSKLGEHGVRVNMDKTYTGPTFIKYTMKPSQGTPMNKITRLVDDLALALEAKSIRVEAPIRGTSLVGIEVPNKNRQTIELAERHKKPGTLEIPIGVDVYGKTLHKDLSEMPHLLIAGQTGSGKSVMLNVILSTLTEQLGPEALSLVLIDPKEVELTQFENVPHIYMPVVTNNVDAANTLNVMVNEMNHRYKTLRKAGCRTVDEYNKKNGKMKKIVVVVDEFADLMMSDLKPSAESMDIKAFNKNLEWEIYQARGKLTQKATKTALKKTIEETAPPSVEESIIRIAQKARAVGMHLILATQRPSADVITGLIKANIPTKIAFSTTSKVNSMIILDQPGAEELTGKGDMLYQDPEEGILRLQGLYK